MPGLMGLDGGQGAGFNGTVMVDGQPLQVRNGVANFRGIPFKVSQDGKVTTETGQQVGQITDGKFEALPPDKLKANMQSQPAG